MQLDHGQGIESAVVEQVSSELSCLLCLGHTSINHSEHAIAISSAER